MFDLEYDNEEDIPSEVRHLYTENDGKFVIMPRSQIKTTSDVTALRESLRKEREDHKETKQQLRRFGDNDPDEIQEKLDRLEELSASGGEGKPDVDAIVEAKLNARVSKVQRELEKAQQELLEREAALTEYKQKETTRTLHDQIRDAAKKQGVLPDAVDALIAFGERELTVDEHDGVVTRDGIGITPGLDPEQWVLETRDKRSYLFPESKGVGARGNEGGSAAGGNPFDRKSPAFSATKQGEMYQKDRARAVRLAKAVGIELPA